jgi:hypothetical protein
MGTGANDYEGLVVDTSRFGLLALKGAPISWSGRLKRVRTEAADFESYSGAKVTNIGTLVVNFEFCMARRDQFADKIGVGS